MSSAAILLTIHLQLVIHLPVEERELALAMATAQTLLASAGIASEWQSCSVLISRCDPANTPDALTVRLLPRKATGSPDCGHLIRDPKLGTVALVYVVRHRELVRDLRHSQGGRSYPSLATLEPGHMTGLAIAHEVGHALNLRHARRGVMKAWLDVDDLRALRESRLAFTTEESARMKAAMLGDSPLSTSGGPPPGALQAAVVRLLARGRRDGSERIALIDAAGQIVVETAGDATSVGDRSIEEVLRDPHASISLLHNHPNGGSLSVTDVANLAKPGCHSVMAVGHDGSQYAVSRGAAFNADRLWSQGHTAFLTVQSELRDTDARHRLASHAVNLALHEMGVVEYRFSLSDELAALARTWHRDIGGAIRRATKKARQKPPFDRDRRLAKAW